MIIGMQMENDKITFLVGLILFIVIVFAVCPSTYAKPPWLLKVPTGENHAYSVGVGESRSGFSEALNRAVAMAITSFATNSDITVHSKSLLLMQEENSDIESKYINEIAVESRSTIVPGLKLIERYTETENIDNGKLWRAWVLLSIPKTSNYSRKSVITRSVVLPGWGQFYRGSKTKGFVFSFGEIAAIGGAIFTAVRQDDFEKKAISSIYQSHRNYYYNQADKYHQANVILVSTAVGLYVLNLADAIFSSSNKADIYYSSFKIEPIVDKGFNLTICLTYNR